jgi:hypothetical protein
MLDRLSNSDKTVYSVSRVSYVKKIPAVVLAAMLSYLASPQALGDKEVTMDDLLMHDGLLYLADWADGLLTAKTFDIPFTGEIGGNQKGTIIDGKRKGPWRVYNQNGQLRHEGQFKDGKMDGVFLTFYDTGQLNKEGNYKKGKYHGTWVYYHENGKLEGIGRFWNGSREGVWVWYHRDGRLKWKYTYKGDELVSQSVALPPCPTSGYQDNCSGTITFDDGSEFVGEIKDGKPHGQGTRTYGEGSYMYANGDKYVGEWKDGKEHGPGILTIGEDLWAGDKYVGDFKEGFHHGHGIYTHSDGRRYVGDWKGGNSNGKGSYIYANGDKYIGEWKDGKMHGQGILKYADGNRYVGKLKDNDPWTGILYSKDGSIFSQYQDGVEIKQE